MLEQMRHAGLAYVPEERMKNGSIGAFTVSENLLLIDHADPQFLRRGLYDFGEIRGHCQKLVDEFAVKTPTLETPVKSLSGGNIQKLILVEQRERGTAILVISEDLDEVFGLSDRIAVIYEGQIMGILDPATATREQVGLMMAGVRPEAASN